MEQESLFCFVWFHYWIIGKFSNIIYRVLLLCYCKRLNVQYFCRSIINVTRYTKHNTLGRERGQKYLIQLNNVRRMNIILSLTNCCLMCLLCYQYCLKYSLPQKDIIERNCNYFFTLSGFWVLRGNDSQQKWASKHSAWVRMTPGLPLRSVRPPPHLRPGASSLSQLQTRRGQRRTAEDNQKEYQERLLCIHCLYWRRQSDNKHLSVLTIRQPSLLSLFCIQTYWVGRWFHPFYLFPDPLLVSPWEDHMTWEGGGRCWLCMCCLHASLTPDSPITRMSTLYLPPGWTSFSLIPQVTPGGDSQIMNWTRRKKLICFIILLRFLQEL